MNAHTTDDQLDRQVARELAVEREREHGERITSDRALLAHNIATAAGALNAARTVLARLRSNEVYDVEFAEGHGATVDHFLLDGWRAAFAAQLIVRDATR